MQCPFSPIYLADQKLLGDAVAGHTQMRSLTLTSHSKAGPKIHDPNGASHGVFDHDVVLEERQKGFTHRGYVDRIQPAVDRSCTTIHIKQGNQKRWRALAKRQSQRQSLFSDSYHWGCPFQVR